MHEVVLSGRLLSTGNVSELEFLFTCLDFKCCDENATAFYNYKGLFNLISRLFHMKMSNKAAKKLHDRMLECVLRSKIEFFETTPIGRIMNRFSRDIDAAESSIPITFNEVLSQLLGIITVTVTISLSTRIFWLALVPIFVLYVLLQVLLGFNLGAQPHKHCQIKRVYFFKKEILYG
jgi:ABC-type multidrug transport system fused ATPase/permease subunit